jgi:RNA polymerase sigma-70 factor (ECF subfamily)
MSFLSCWRLMTHLVLSLPYVSFVRQQESYSRFVALLPPMSGCLLSEAASPPDGELVRRIRAGDVEMYRVLVERYRAEFGRYASAMLDGDKDDAADALQEAFIRAYDSLASCRDPNRFKAWLFRIVSNQCHNVRKRRRGHLSLERAAEHGEEPASRADDERADIGEVLGMAMNALTTEQREAFILKHVEGRSYAEIAEMLAVGEDALKMRVYRARDELKKRLEELL